MVSTEFEKALWRGRLKYEWARARRAVIGFAPALLLIAVATPFAREPSSTAVLGGSMFAVGVTLLWYGRTLKQSVLPGLLAGMVPLVLILCVNNIGHICGGGSCTTACLPACAVGGIVAGLTVARIGYRAGHGPGFWLSGSTVALLTGAMGCVCVGSSGLIGLTIGFGAGMVPTMAQALFARNPIG